MKISGRQHAGRFQTSYSIPFRGVAIFAGLLTAMHSTRASSAVENPAGDEQVARCDAVMRAQLAKPFPPSGCWRDEDFALAAYWLNQRTTEADQAIVSEREKDFSASVKGGDFHWHAYLLERIYFLFAHDSTHFPGRMSLPAESALLDMLWKWAGPRCRLEMTLPERDWWAWGSENHHAQAWASFWGAAQIFAQHPDYKNLKYADGTTPQQMAAAFNDYYMRFARERAAKGLLVECNSDYNRYTLGGWYNITDFSSDQSLRRRMGMLLDVFWTDWAIEQIGGVRGGSRHRCYPGATSTTGSGMDGTAWFGFGLGPPMSKAPKDMCAATTFWRPSPIVVDLARDVAGRGVYEIISRRPGLAQVEEKNAPTPSYDREHADSQFASGVYPLNPQGGGLLRYTYCTPDFVMGTSMVEARPREDWMSISSQNRWEGVIFAGHPTARIFVQSPNPPRGSVYNANWSVQKHGVLIVQRLKTSNAKGQRIWFDASLTRVENNNWIFAEAPGAFAAVHVVEDGTAWEADTLAQHRSKNGPTNLGSWLRCQDEFSPIIIEVAQKSQCASFAEFQRATLANPLHFENARLEYSSALSSTTLTLFADYSKPPLVDGQPVNYAPRKVFDSPYLQADFGSGVITIQHAAQKVVLDFNK